MGLNSKWVLLLTLLLTFIISSPVKHENGSQDSQTGLCERQKPCQLLTPADAEKILGQPVRLIQDSSVLKGDVRQCICSYKGVTKDPVSGQDINLYFAFEEKENKPTPEQAHQVMETTKNDNAHDTTITDLSGIGDEAFRLGDTPNVHFILVRKGAIIIRLQIKQATEKTSLEELKAFARVTAKRL
jgi:hypothetical protein